MPPTYIKPENALKRTEELLALGTAQSREQAFDNLIEVFQSKRFKHTPVNVLEPIMLKFVDLCVLLSRKSHARAGLLNYKNAAQGTSIQTIETVLNHFIAQAEANLAAADEQAKKEVAALPENPLVDDELPVQPLTMLLDTFIDNAGDRERIERRLIAPAQKFCWDAYDISLDVAKGNDRLEVIYQSIAHRAFNFCKVHQRKNDFRRLCEQRLRKDLANAQKYGHQQHSINLADPETLSRSLDTRFLQLETAVELELWQEAFRSVEDVHGLVAGKKSAKPAMMANYYEKLTQIFKAEGGKQTAIFHAAAWARYIQYAERAGSVPDRAPGCVLLSALAVPLGDVESKQRLIALLNLPKMPTREALVKDAAAKHLRRVSPEIRKLYEVLEVDFQPLKSSKILAPLTSALGPEYQPYLPALREVVLSRLVQGLSRVYDTVSLSHILSLVKPFDGTSWETDMAALEKFLMSACHQGDINASIDHVAKSITFAIPAADPNRLSDLAICLYNTMQYLDPAPVTSRADVFANALAEAEEERKAVTHRRQIVQKRRELLEEANLRRDRAESTAKAEAAKIKAENQAKQAKELAKQAEYEQLQKEIGQTQRAEAIKLAQSLAATGTLTLDISSIDNLDSSMVVALQVQQLAKEKKEMNDRLRIVSKRVDHLERALRKEERPLLSQDYERQKEEDRASHERNSVQARGQAIQQQKAAVELKGRLARMMPDYLVARQLVESKREQEFQTARAAAQKKIAAEKEKFKASVIARRKAEKEEREKRRLAEEEEERKLQEQEEEEARMAEEREEEERAAREEIEKRKAEAEERAAEKKAKQEAERAEREASARKQMEREEEAMRRRQGGASASPRRPESAVPTPAAPLAPTAVKAGGWREKLAAKQGAEGTSGAASGSPAPVTNGTPPPGEVPDRGGVYRRGMGTRGRGGGTGTNTPPTRGGSSRW